MHRRPGVLAVEAEILGEVVSSTRRDADERKAVLDGNRGHQRLRAVATSHAEAVGSSGDSVASELLEVEPLGQRHRLDPKLGSEIEETELLDLASARPWVAQQHGPLRPTGSTSNGRRMFGDGAAERVLGEANRGGEDRDDQDGAPRSVDGAAGGDTEGERYEGEAGEPEQCRRHPQDRGLGHQPPGCTSEQCHTKDPEDERALVAQENHHREGHGETLQRERHEGGSSPIPADSTHC